MFSPFAKALQSTVYQSIVLCSFLTLFSAAALAQDRGIGVQGRIKTSNLGRDALVIGNSTYRSSPLKNPVNDARDIAGALQRVGFKVDLVLNANRKQMRHAIREFGNKLKRGGVGLFFYAGHGMQVNGRNFLIPVGVEIGAEDEVVDEAVDAGSVLRKMQSANNRMNMVFLDACRNNPFARSFRSGSKGLAQMDAPKGSLIAYATAPGSVAADGVGRNGIFTASLLRHLETPGLELSAMMKRVRSVVASQTRNKQIPWDSSSLTGDFYFAQGRPEGFVQSFEASPRTPSKPTSGPAKTIDVEETFWRAIESSTHPDDFKEYLSNYPQGRFNAVARLKLRQLQRNASASPPLRSPPRLSPSRPILSAPAIRRPLDGRPIKIVDASGRGDFTTISSAMNAAAPGSVIRIRPGRYTESITMNKELHLEGGGNSRSEVVIEAKSGNCLAFKANLGSLSNVTLRLLNGSKNFCVDITKGRFLLENNDISSQGLAAIGVRGRNTDPIIRGNTIHNSAQGGMLVYNNALGRIENNDIFQNKLAGIEIRQGADPLVIGNRVHNGKAGGILVQQKGRGRLENNFIYQNFFTGIEIRDHGDPLVTRNRIYDGRQSGVFVQKQGQGRIENNDIYNNGLGGIWVQTGGNPKVIGNRIYNNKPEDIVRKKTALGVYKNNQKAF